MRALYSVVLLTGCLSGDDLVVPGSANPGPDPGGVVTPVDPPRLIPQVCGTRTWPTVEPDAKASDVTVVPTRLGATILAVASDGGPVRGFRVNLRGEVVGDPLGTTVLDAASYTAISAGVLDDRLVVGAVDGDRTTLAIVSDDLTATHELGQIEGTFLGEAPIMPARDTRIAVVGGPGGVTASTFDGVQWLPQGSLTITKAAIQSMTATAYLGDSLIAWSTDDNQCHLKRFTAPSETRDMVACDHVRIAVDPTSPTTTKTGTLVYEEQGNVMRSQITIEGMWSQFGAHTLVATGASSPRVVFDGVRTWISYLDGHGDVIVGFLDAKGGFVSRALIDVRPQHDAYELAYFSGGVHVVSISEQGFGAQRLCVQPL